METIRKTASKMISDCECAMAKQQEAEKKDVATDKKMSVMDKLKSKLNIVGSQPKVDKALENKVKTPELAR